MRVTRCMEGLGQPLHSSCCLCTCSSSGNQQQPRAPHHMLSCRLQVVNFKGVTGWFYRDQSSLVLSENPHLCGPMLTARSTQLLLFPCELWLLPPPPSEHQNIRTTPTLRCSLSHSPLIQTSLLLNPVFS